MTKSVYSITAEAIQVPAKYVKVAEAPTELSHENPSFNIGTGA